MKDFKLDSLLNLVIAVVVVAVAAAAVSWVVGIVPLLGWLFSWVIRCVAFVIIVLLVFNYLKTTKKIN